MAEDKEEKSEKQKPEKPRKSGGGGGGEINFQKLLIIIGGVIIAQVIVLVVVIKMILPSSEPAEGDAAKNGNSEVKKEGNEEDQAFMEDAAKLKYTSLKFDYITTKDFQWYILLQLGFKVLPKPVEGEEAEAEAPKEGGKEKEGFQLPPELISITKSKVIEYFGALSIEEVQAIPRDSMIVVITQKLKPLFLSSKLLLKSIALEQFTPTKVN